MPEVVDVVGPDPAVADSPWLTAARSALDAVASRSAALDVEGVTRGDVAALADAGLLAPWTPEGLGGVAAPAAACREVQELLAGASGALWFVLAQHRSPTEAAVATASEAVRNRWAQPLASGQALGAVSFAHLRRPGPPQVRAVPHGDGWRVSGRLDWVTSWGLADAWLLLAETDDAQVLSLLLPARPRNGVTVTGPLELAAMSGTSTVGMRLADVAVDPDEVAAAVPKAQWLRVDDARTVNASPAAFGIARTALAHLTAQAGNRASQAGQDLAGHLAERLTAVRREAYALLDEGPPEAEASRRLELRAQSLDLALRAATAVVAVDGGRSMMLDQPGQRWLREAAFLLVQAQTADLRDRLLRDWSAQIRPASRSSATS